ncbi:nuclear transport factor 2 family protein [Elizabethkingia sp. JS20170427COW]|uniref:nuclear transport factor 2 family protein n=1 Tax=Elizabethkingia sp. JS20170427COW TaxID=2583851 RepID=UPI00111012DB|nr:nuclear transport factor 2 family protein [Elizabethkingia sp. JS20170427COW]QCX54216.1 hypothetical protein FGE20_10925 [Elizabethkingia sp. JS20170427COW]
MRKQIILMLCFISFIGFKAQKNETQIDKLLTEWHLAASRSDFNAYFHAFTKDAVYIGTDAKERWTKGQFASFSKPYFDRGKAWNFKTIERHISIAKDKKTAWFDEILDTPNMGICRGSGVLVKEKNGWKISHYVLSMIIPNDIANTVTEQKAAIDQQILEEKK